MELEFATVKELKLFDSAVREQPIEADLVLPEYYPPIGRILKCFASPSEEAVTLAEGRVSVAGAATLRLLYADAENRLHCFQTETKYTKILQADCRCEQAAVRVTQDVRSVACRALGPKRVEIKASVAVRAELLGAAEDRVVTGADAQVQLLTRKTEYCEPACVHCREFTDSDTARFETAGRLTAVVAVSAVPLPEKTEAVSNKLLLRGRTLVTAVCAAEDGAVTQVECSVPFSEVLDCYGVSEETDCRVVFSRCEAEVTLPEDGGGDAEVTVRNKVLIVAATQKELSCVTDAYAVGCEAEPAFCELTPARAITVLAEEETVSAETDSDDEVASVQSVFVTDLSWAVSGGPEGDSAEGTLCFNALCRDAEGRFSLTSRTVTFGHRFPAGLRCVVCEAAVKNLTGERSADGKLRFGCALVFTVLTASGERLRMLTGLKEGEKAAGPRQERAVVYFAEKGERLWDIAKENRTSVEAIRTMNSLSGDVIENDARLIFSGC